MSVSNYSTVSKKSFELARTVCVTVEEEDRLAPGQTGPQVGQQIYMNTNYALLPGGCWAGDDGHPGHRRL